MTYPPDKKQEFLEVLSAKMGLVMLTCKEVGIHRNTYRNWYDTDPEFRSAVDDIMGLQCDFVEAQLLTLIREGDTSATIFYLKTKGKNRGYSQTTQAEAQPPQPAALPSPEETERTERAIKKRAKAKKDYIVKLLKQEGKYTKELTVQVTLVADLLVKYETLQEEMRRPDYQPILVETSREGNCRGKKNPAEDLFISYQSQIQRALRALGMNTDAKERKTDNDEFSEFMEHFKEGGNE